MRRPYIGVEFSHDKVAPHATIMVKTRFGPVKRWVDAYVPHLVDGVLRERVALVMPQGFRFQKDVVKNRQGKNPKRTWADGKFFMAMDNALQKYLPYKTKTDAAVAKPEATDGADKGTEEGETTEVQEKS
jgi:hypothetical protein